MAKRARTKMTRGKTGVRRERLAGIDKVQTGISGFDEITNGGLPAGRPTLICGGPGCGKTLFCLETLVNCAKRGAPGVFVTFEEPIQDVIANSRAMNHNLESLMRRKRLAFEYVRVERAEVEETGEYDLEALFIRLDHAIQSIGAKTIVLDTIESLFAGLTNDGVLRAELRRLFGWLKDRGITTLVTGERGVQTLTRQGLEEYVSDCVILLDHRVVDQISTRRMRIVKYRGSTHGTNEYPFLIDDRGIAVLPITSLRLEHPGTLTRVSTGLPWLDDMFGGKGYYRASSVLISGAAGTAKTSFAAHFVAAACRRRDRAIIFNFEESPAQYVRNMRSIGIDLQPCIDAGVLRVCAARATFYGLESHLTQMHRDVEEMKPAIVVIDPISSFTGGSTTEVSGMMMRLIDFLKNRNITAMFTHLIPGGGSGGDVDLGVSSLMDTWIVLRNAPAVEGGRQLAILKSRGMAHATSPRAFRLTDRGAILDDLRR